MTQAIADALGGQPEVTLRLEGPSRPNPLERQLLALQTGGRVQTREISLTVAGRSALIARSITPMKSAVVAQLKGLGRKPLAELLFQDPRWQRRRPPLAIQCVNTALKGRASVWEHRGQRTGRLLVEEYFLPVLLAHRPI
jgi:chorismate-pyruvate lyase